jgi:hypothetical protein
MRNQNQVMAMVAAVAMTSVAISMSVQFIRRVESLDPKKLDYLQLAAMMVFGAYLGFRVIPLVREYIQHAVYGRRIGVNRADRQRQGRPRRRPRI